MKEVDYNTNSQMTLAYDVFNGYEYLVVHLGTYPAAYIRIPENHPYYNGDFWIFRIRVRSGLDFGGTLEKLGQTGFWIGWEYNHFGDFVLNQCPVSGYQHKKYTTSEILDDVYKVIEQLEVIRNDSHGAPGSVRDSG